MISRVVEDKIWIVSGPAIIAEAFLEAPTWYLARERAGGPDIFRNVATLARSSAQGEYEFLDEDSFFCRRKSDACQISRCMHDRDHPGPHLHPTLGELPDVPPSLIIAMVAPLVGWLVGLRVSRR